MLLMLVQIWHTFCFVDSRSNGGKRSGSAAVGNTPDREGKDRGDKVKKLVGVPTVPVLLAAVTPFQSAANVCSSSGVEVSVENVEIMFKRLFQNLKAEICSETADLVATHVSSFSSEIASGRSELAVERDERNAQSDVVVSRVDSVMLRVDVLESESRATQSLYIITRVQALEAVNT